MLDFCLLSICFYFDIILLMVIWYEKDDMNILDMYLFIYLLFVVVDLVWEVKSDWEIYKVIVKKFFEVCVGYLGKEIDIVMLFIQYDFVVELVQLLDVKDWKKGECDLISGKIVLYIMVVECDYLVIYECFIFIGLLMEKIGNGGKGIVWNIQSEMDLLCKFNYIKVEGLVKGQLMLNIVIDVVEMILILVLEINGQVVVKVWVVLSEFIGCDYMYLVLNKEDEKICFCDIQVQLCKIIFSLIWFGLEDEYVFYNVGYINVYELILWCMFFGCQ